MTSDRHQTKKRVKFENNIKNCQTFFQISVKITKKTTVPNNLSKLILKFFLHKLVNQKNNQVRSKEAKKMTKSHKNDTKLQKIYNPRNMLK